MEKRLDMNKNSSIAAIGGGIAAVVIAVAVAATCSLGYLKTPQVSE